MAILYLIIILFGVTFDICLYGVLVYTKSLLYFCIFVQRVYFLQQVNYFVISGYWKTPVLSPCILRALCTAAFSIKRECAAGYKIINCCKPETLYIYYKKKLCCCQIFIFSEMHGNAVLNQVFSYGYAGFQV